VEELEQQRKEIAEKYLEEIRNPLVELPKVQDDCKHVWHLFVVRCEQREELQKYLAKHGVGTQIHYPVPPHLSQAYEHFGHKKGDFPITEKLADTILSLPLFNGMTPEQAHYVIKIINKFEGGE